MKSNPTVLAPGYRFKAWLTAKRMIGRLLASLALGAVLFVFAFPLLWMCSYSLRSTDLPSPIQFELFVLPLAWDNYARVLNTLPLTRYLWNSVLVVGAAVPLTLIAASWAGLALTQVSARVRVALLLMSIALLLVPAPALWLPRFILYTRLGWINTLFALIAPALMGSSPFYVIMFYIAFARVPIDLIESAQLEGANLLQVWSRVALPLARPTLVAVAVLSFVFYWSNFIDPFLYLRSEANFTLPVGIQTLQAVMRSNWPLLMAAAVMMAAPVLVVFLLAQRLFLQGEITLARWLR